MSVAFPAFHRIQHPLALPLPEAKQRAKQAAAHLRWKLARENETELVFKAGLSLWSWGEEVKVGFGTNDVLVHSQCRLPTQCFDHGKNRQNCEQFALAYNS